MEPRLYQDVDIFLISSVYTASIESLVVKI